MARGNYSKYINNTHKLNTKREANSIKTMGQVLN